MKYMVLRYYSVRRKILRPTHEPLCELNLHIDETEGKKTADNNSQSKGRLTGEDTLVEANGKIPGLFEAKH
jgi:hypothetical protein